MDKREDIIDKVKRFKDIVLNSNIPMKINHVYLFGSYANGNPHEHSDIDVAFVIERFKGDFLKLKS